MGQYGSAACYICSGLIDEATYYVYNQEHTFKFSGAENCVK